MEKIPTYDVKTVKHKVVEAVSIYTVVYFKEDIERYPIFDNIGKNTYHIQLN
jgi:hypothetical protein